MKVLAIRLVGSLWSVFGRDVIRYFRPKVGKLIDFGISGVKKLVKGAAKLSFFKPPWLENKGLLIANMCLTTWLAVVCSKSFFGMIV